VLPKHARYLIALHLDGDKEGFAPKLPLIKRRASITPRSSLVGDVEYDTLSPASHSNPRPHLAVSSLGYSLAEATRFELA
jgi:hypothetical protein